MSQHHLFVTLTTETSLHAGSGESQGIVDLPIQREAHTGWPCVYGSSVKGALRSNASKLQPSENSAITTLFGPDPEGVRGGAGADYAGALLIGDARLLLLPVRSLTTHNLLVTCPSLLRRLDKDLKRSGIKSLDLAIDIWADLAPDSQECIVLDNRFVDIYVEEFAFKAKAEAGISLLVESLVTITDEDFRRELNQKLCIIGDDHFAYICSAAIPVSPHIAIKSETKTAVEGALWYEESLPPETLLYTPVVCNPSRNIDDKKTGKDISVIFKSMFDARPYLQLGGNETTGMGWCKVTCFEESCHGQV